MKKIIIPYFSLPLKYSAALMLSCLGIYLWIIGYPLWNIAFVLIIIILFTTNYVTEINVNRKTYRDYILFLGASFDEEKSTFEKIEKIVIVRQRHVQTQYSQARSSQLTWNSFTGMIVFDNNKTLDLVTTTSKKELMEGLKFFSEFLNVGIEDQTAGAK